MEYARYRRHPRVYQKKSAEKEEDNSIVLSGTVASGILAFVFAQGIILGCMLRKRLR